MKPKYNIKNSPINDIADFMTFDCVLYESNEFQVWGQSDTLYKTSECLALAFRFLTSNFKLTTISFFLKLNV